VTPVAAAEKRALSEYKEEKKTFYKMYPISLDR
jgi:hypothetical protein